MEEFGDFGDDAQNIQQPDNSDPFADAGMSMNTQGVGQFG